MSINIANPAEAPPIGDYVVVSPCAGSALGGAFAAIYGTADDLPCDFLEILDRIDCVTRIELR